jgi:predicted MFS family arabinose efflux permease
MAVTPALGGWIIAIAGMRAMFLASLACIVASTVAAIVIREWPRATDVASPTADKKGAERWYMTTLHVYREALANRSIQRLFLIVGTLYLSTFVGVSLLPNFLHDRLGLDPSAVSALGTGAAIVGVAASLVLARSMRWLGEDRALAISEAMLVLGFALSLAAPSLGAWGIVAAGSGFALRGGVQAQQAVARAMIASAASGTLLGPTFALLSIIYNTAVTVGPALAGLVYTLDPALPLVVGVVVGVPMAVWLLLRPRSP